jgi:UDP-3-O-[3-hydroxymyristoyl] N-acetylglucosamine deacetylase
MILGLTLLPGMPDEVRTIPQRTIRQPVALVGVGIHSGHQATVICHQAPMHDGIVFVRADLPGSPEIHALEGEVSDTRRGVTLGAGPTVRTVEHLLAAAAMLEVSNLRVEVHGEELPILDGSAAPYVDALAAAGVVEQDARRPVYAVARPVWVARDTAWMLAVPAEAFRATYIVPLDQTTLGTQVADFDPRRHRFATQFAPARTWGFAHELEALRQAGFARGATAENALGIGSEGYLSPPRFPDEPARHKVVDLVGDLALLGTPLQAHVIAYRAGHTLHVEFVRQLARVGRSPLT